MTISPTGLSLTSRLPIVGSDIIKASWRRCFTDYHLDPLDRRGPPLASRNTLKVLQGEMAEMLSDSTMIINRLRGVAREVDRIVLIANADGIIVSNHADSPISQEILREGFAIGSILHEQHVGTNGIGTCIASRQPITINAEAHFNKAFRGFTCSAAPVFGPDGSVLAAIDISGRLRSDRAEGNFAQHFIYEAAQLISLLLFRKKHKSDCIVLLSNAEDTIPFSTQALVATDETGKILGATADGFACLGVSDLQALAGRSLSDICKANFSELKPLSGQSLRLQTPGGGIAYATAFMDKKPAAAIAVRKSRPAITALATRPLERIAGRDAAMGEIVAICRKIIDRDIPLLVLGETGVGKDTLARAIHAESARAGKPYIAVNCAAIPATLLASELFGYAPGTFTDGCKEGRIGKIAASTGGTLFLDEIGDMPLDLQAHLLQVLEDRIVTPLGSTAAVPVDVKIICATHRDLQSMVQAGRFRQDLYYRIRGAQFVIPALRQRSDLEALVAAVIRDEAQSEGYPSVAIAAGVLALFNRYPWPGNIRELRNVIRYALSLHSDEQEIQIAHLPDQLLEFWRQEAVIEPQQNLDNADAANLDKSGMTTYSNRPTRPTLKAAGALAERQRILDVLNSLNWNIAVAAGQLGISRATLHRKMRLHAIAKRKGLGAVRGR
ncbi:MAG: sigma-54-dependent Fis family transcriptional regulator [Hyphomicrobium sp.]|nr:sigma-54-dependent Fis family transcriptional regulator [Hyphomicrobium sp.]